MDHAATRKKRKQVRHERIEEGRRDGGEPRKPVGYMLEISRGEEGRLTGTPESKTATGQPPLQRGDGTLKK